MLPEARPHTEEGGDTQACRLIVAHTYLKHLPLEGQGAPHREIEALGAVAEGRVQCQGEVAVAAGAVEAGVGRVKAP